MTGSLEFCEVTRLTDPALTTIDTSLLHPSTSPEAIRSQQRQVIREAQMSFGEQLTPDEISAFVDLPVSVITARLAEMRHHLNRSLENEHVEVLRERKRRCDGRTRDQPLEREVQGAHH